ncbi:class E sortase [Nocardioides sp.]|uniref:class E sortase n=1 Tax=Nocardioides sp. TaxID=35761 RepID=UPI0037834ED0
MARRRRTLLAAGVVLLLAGAAVLAWIGWEYVGSNWVSARRHAAVVDDLHRGWSEGETSVHVDAGTADAIVRIPRFGSDYAVPVLEGTSDTALASGFGHVEGTAGPGEVGNYALAAHRVTHGEPLRDLPDLEVGDEVLVDTARTTYTYRLVTGGDALTVPFTAGWVLDPLPTNPEDGGVEPPQRPGQRLLTLTTCSELFHTDDRLVAFAELVSSSPRRGR